jgi:hypothetical protein
VTIQNKQERGEKEVYKVFDVPGGYQIFWCPSAPIHYNDRIPYNGKIYSKKQAAYRRNKQLNEQLKAPKSGKESAVV